MKFVTIGQSGKAGQRSKDMGFDKAYSFCVLLSFDPSTSFYEIYVKIFILV